MDLDKTLHTIMAHQARSNQQTQKLMEVMVLLTERQQTIEAAVLAMSNGVQVVATSVETTMEALQAIMKTSHAMAEAIVRLTDEQREIDKRIERLVSAMEAFLKPAVRPS